MILSFCWCSPAGGSDGCTSLFISLTAFVASFRPHILPVTQSVLSKLAFDVHLLTFDRLNRYSMPVQGFASQLRNKYPGFGPTNAFGHINTTGFLFGDEEENHSASADHSGLASPDIKSYLQLTDDKFPTLIRRDDNSGLVSTCLLESATTLTSAALCQLGCVGPRKLPITGTRGEGR